MKDELVQKERTMNDKVIELTDDNFETEVLRSDVPVLVDFWASWCGSCRVVGPTIDQLANEFDGQAKIGKLNVDEHGEVTQQFGISSIPAVLLFKDGQVVDTLIGVQNKEQYVAALEQLMAPA